MTKFVLVMFIFGLLLVGCEIKRPPSSISLIIWNDSSSTNTSIPLCEGGLKVKIQVANTTVFDLTAPSVDLDAPGGEATRENEFLSESVRLGDTVLVEAWCMSGNAEVGYAKLEGKLAYDRNSNGVVVSRPSSLEPCLKPTEQRGQPPCISSTIIE